MVTIDYWHVGAWLNLLLLTKCFTTLAQPPPINTKQLREIKIHVVCDDEPKNVDRLKQYYFKLFLLWIVWWNINHTKSIAIDDALLYNII